MAFCGNCGKEMGDGVKFCPSCGASATGEPAKSAKPAKIEKVEKEKKAGTGMESPLVAFARPYIELIDSGKLFGLVYYVMAILNAILPFAILYQIIDSGILKLGGKFVAAFILTWLVAAFAFWIGFQLWWARRKKPTALAASEFSATPIFSEILQTFGEWLGTLIAIIGVGGGLITTIFLGSSASYLFGMMGMGFLNYGLLNVIVAPVIGFFTIILFRFMGEQLRIVAALANNTKEIALNIKNKH